MWLPSASRRALPSAVTAVVDIAVSLGHPVRWCRLLEAWNRRGSHLLAAGGEHLDARPRSLSADFGDSGRSAGCRCPAVPWTVPAEVRRVHLDPPIRHPRRARSSPQRRATVAGQLVVVAGSPWTPRPGPARRPVLLMSETGRRRWLTCPGPGGPRGECAQVDGACLWSKTACAEVHSDQGFPRSRCRSIILSTSSWGEWLWDNALLKSRM